MRAPIHERENVMAALQRQTAPTPWDMYCTVQSATRREVVVLCRACAQAPASAGGRSRRRPRQPARNFRCIDIAQKAIIDGLVRRGGAEASRAVGTLALPSASTQHAGGLAWLAVLGHGAGCCEVPRPSGTATVASGSGSGVETAPAGAQSSGMAASVVSSISNEASADTMVSELAAAPRHQQRQALLSTL
ncbi:hypothetical protein IQ07DRAFT_3755 [Pyrenochaeta sp. DS3sAY3a]|nr:hypothetical protein IQ07DRAFT_3755 [Pyrenochaeta sp. DS3sAY3a]